MLDPNFKRTVIMLCEHAEEGGTVGFILNKTLNIKVCDALVDFDEVKNELFMADRWLRIHCIIYIDMAT